MSNTGEKPIFNHPIYKQPTMKTNHLLFCLLLLGISQQLLFSQSINLHSISTERMPFGDSGYTLDGGQMISTSTEKLLDEANFGPNGTYPKSINLTHAYAFSGDLEFISEVEDIDLFFFGTFDKNNSSINSFTEAEIDSLYNWSMNGGKIIIGSAANSSGFTFDFQVLDEKWGFGVEFNPFVSIIPSSFGVSTEVFNGPFGIANYINQGGTIQGYFNQVPENSIILGEDELLGEPTLFLDCNTLDLIIADGDAVTALGGVTFGGGIANDNDKFWTNLIVYMDNLQSQPALSLDGNTLSTGNYSSYQWFKDGNAISGATSASYNTNGEPGSYTVEVSLDCGCNNVSSSSFTIVSVNDHIYNAMGLSLYPNPASLQSTLSFTLKESENLRITITDLGGREIKSVFEGYLNAGLHQFSLLTDLNQHIESGLYSVELIGDKTSTHKRFIIQN